MKIIEIEKKKKGNENQLGPSLSSRPTEISYLASTRHRPDQHVGPFTRSDVDSPTTKAHSSPFTYRISMSLKNLIFQNDKTENSQLAGASKMKKQRKEYFIFVILMGNDSNTSR